MEFKKQEIKEHQITEVVVAEFECAEETIHSLLVMQTELKEVSSYVALLTEK